MSAEHERGNTSFLSFPGVSILHPKNRWVSCGNIMINLNLNVCTVAGWQEVGCDATRAWAGHSTHSTADGPGPRSLRLWDFASSTIWSWSSPTATSSPLLLSPFNVLDDHFYRVQPIAPVALRGVARPSLLVIYISKHRRSFYSTVYAVYTVYTVYAASNPSDTDTPTKKNQEPR